MGPQETNLLFDIWMGNSSEQGRHSPVHAIFAEKYKPRVSYTGEVYQVWVLPIPILKPCLQFFLSLFLFSNITFGLAMSP